MQVRRPSIFTLGVCLFALSLLPAHGQPPTAQERDSLLTHLQQTRDAFMAAVSDLSDAQWRFKAAPDRWSIAEVAEHIAISETTILQIVRDQIVKGPVTPRD